MKEINKPELQRVNRASKIKFGLKNSKLQDQDNLTKIIHDLVIGCDECEAPKDNT